ncbi:MAG: NAD(P)-binding domain-containing protein, partial [Pseudomonadota bacterium]
MTQKTAVIGLGSMGYGMASSCLRAGHTTYGFDVVEQRVSQFRSEGGAAGDLRDVASELDAAVLVVLNAAQTEGVLFGAAGLAPNLRKGAVVLACATVPPDFARDMAARCAERGVHYLDAPISGGSIKAAAGELSVMAAGSPEAFAA